MQNTRKITKILNERGDTYGDYTEMAAVSQAIKDAVLQGSALLNPAQRESIEMIAVKMARIACGDPDHVDSWDDIAGYATLISNLIRGKK